MEPKEKTFGIDLEDEVVRGSIVTHEGKVLPPVVPKNPSPVAPKPATVTVEEPIVALTPFQTKSREVATVTAGMGGALALGTFTGPLFMGNMFTFALTSLIGYRVVWGVTPALHSPLMSVTNAISGMVGVGGLFVMGGGYVPETLPHCLGAASVLLAFVNISGGFVISKRMLDMFKSKSSCVRRISYSANRTIQDRPILQNIPGFMQSRQLSLVAATSRLQQQAQLV